MQKIDEKLRGLSEDELLQKMLEDDPSKRMTSTEVVNQLSLMKIKLIGKERELRLLYSSDYQFDLRENIKELLQFPIDVNSKDVIGRNALHLLCMHNLSGNSTGAIQILIQSGIDVNAKDYSSQTALECLRRRNLGQSSKQSAEAIQILENATGTQPTKRKNEVPHPDGQSTKRVSNLQPSLAE